MNVVCPIPIFLGYACGNIEPNIQKAFNAIIQKDPKVPLEFHISAHGSPGKLGSMGMGFDDEQHYNYCLTTSEFINVLKENGLDDLKSRHLYFVFRIVIELMFL